MFRSTTFHQIASVAAAVILAWTAADLGRICPLDEEGFPSPVEQSSQDQLPTGSEDVHFDDCFCCSHCVRPSVSFSLIQGTQIQPFDFAVRWDAPSVTPRDFFHPPKLT